MHLILVAAAAFAQAGEFETLRARFELEKEKPVAQRLATVAAIGALKSLAAGSFLEELFEQDKNPIVRAETLKALGACATLRKVVAVAGDASQPFELRVAAIEAITRPSTEEGLPVVRAVIKELDEIRLHGWMGLRSYPLDRTELMWRTALGDRDVRVRAMAFMALAPLKEVRLHEKARETLANRDATPILRHASVSVLQAWGGAVGARSFIAAATTNDLTLRRLLAEALGSLADEKSVIETYAAIRNPDPAVRVVTARALGRLNHPQAGDRLAELFKDKNIEVRAAALESVAERREKSAEAILHREAQGVNEEMVAVAIGLLPAFPSDATKQLLARLAGHDRPGTAIPALEALGETCALDGLPVFEKALLAKGWPVRVAAIRGLLKLRRKESIDLLVDRMDKEEGRMVAEISNALKALTGKPFGIGAGQWREWWTVNRDGFALPPAALARETSRQGLTTYHGVPVFSVRIVFVTDISASMSETAETGSRMDQAKKELDRVLSTLGKEAQVNMVFFNDRVESWRKGLVPIQQNLPAALATIARLTPSGRTNIFDALDEAFRDGAVDTIYLLSDGDPTDGKIVDSEEILREIRRMNRSRQIEIHAVSFGQSRFMQALAAQNGGQYVEMK
jgi:HEAT repeat protein